MANKTIADLTAGATLDGTELFHGVQGGNSRKFTSTQVAELLAKRTNAPINLALSAVVALNAMTISIKGADGNDPSATNPVYIPIRSATANSGDIDVLAITSATSLVVSSGSTLGSINGVAVDIIVVAFNDAGTLRLGVVNQKSGMQAINGIASSTAEGGAGAADSSGVIYTGTAVTAKPYAVLGCVSATEATAGTWATAPSAVLVGSDAQAFLAKASAGLPMFACRAWVSFNGVTGAIMGAGNVSSITKNGTGDYTVNFTTAMPDTAYSIVATGQIDQGGGTGYSTVGLYRQASAKQAGSVRICSSTITPSAFDYTIIDVQVFR